MGTSARIIGYVNCHDVSRRDTAVTIGMPVFNAEATVVAALASVLAQDALDLSVIVSDNASTDRTGQLVESIARNDSRVEYFRQEVNIGPARNFNYVLGLAETPFFAWAASDDTQDRDYIRRCIERLQQHPEAVLCHADADETILGTNGPFLRYEGACGVSRSILWRYLDVHRRFPDLHVYGVFRTAIAKRIGGMDVGPSGDIAFCRKMALQGPFCYEAGTMHHRVIGESWKPMDSSSRQAHEEGRQSGRPSTHLLRTSQADIMASSVGTGRKVVLLMVTTWREGHRRVIVLVVGLLGASRGLRSSRGLALRLFNRFYAKGNYTVLDEDVFLRRIVRPVLRWKAD